MPIDNSRRKRRRRPTMTPRFGQNSLALEIGLLRLTLDLQREAGKLEQKSEEKK